ncbi:MAG: hypothetical protein LBG99_08915 [Propionibacteriaceae bacterium]|nr:hypothetical protein [Propionibacteriaceae bacterium]
MSTVGVVLDAQKIGGTASPGSGISLLAIFDPSASTALGVPHRKRRYPKALGLKIV